MPSPRGLATIVKVPQGWIALARTATGLRRTTLPKGTQSEALAELGQGWQRVSASEDALLSSAAEALRVHCSGQPPVWSIPLDLSDLPEFTRRVLLACRAIPFGRTRTYADLAREVGRPQAARAVGQVMRRNPMPLVIPCHRVVGSNGSLVGFAGGARALDLKASLLALEGHP
jgi:methylated-DNA-[protein]-cysteine S-methyltransferase